MKEDGISPIIIKGSVAFASPSKMQESGLLADPVFSYAFSKGKSGGLSRRKRVLRGGRPVESFESLAKKNRTRG